MCGIRYEPPIVAIDVKIHFFEGSLTDQDLIAEDQGFIERNAARVIANPMHSLRERE
jgi:hypothetical protein